MQSHFVSSLCNALLLNRRLQVSVSSRIHNTPTTPHVARGQYSGRCHQNMAASERSLAA